MTEPDDELRTFARQLFSDSPEPEQLTPPARPEDDQPRPLNGIFSNLN